VDEVAELPIRFGFEGCLEAASLFAVGVGVAVGVGKSPSASGAEVRARGLSVGVGTACDVSSVWGARRIPRVDWMEAPVPV
jgi:hypothetical protein